MLQNRLQPYHGRRSTVSCIKPRFDEISKPLHNQGVQQHGHDYIILAMFTM
jgi:hypothetical protein